MHLNGTKSKEELFNDVYGQIQNKIEELLNMQVHGYAYNCNSNATLLKAVLKKHEAITWNMFMYIFLFRNKLLMMTLGSEESSCLLCAVCLTATEVPASVKTLNSKIWLCSYGRN